jgi:hypothetical protein
VGQLVVGRKRLQLVDAILALCYYARQTEPKVDAYLYKSLCTSYPGMPH